jgi:hypothetical protein
MAFERAKTYTTTCPTYGYWFERFILGCHKRMEAIVVTDFALLKELCHELLAQLEEDFGRAQSDRERAEVVEFAHVLTFGYLCGLRGEEIMKVDASGLLK